MRQRVMIAMALSCNPSLLIADEPTTALDVTIQAQILELMKRLQRDHGSSIVLITHDMGVVAELAERVVVMYAGRVVEEGAEDAALPRPAAPVHVGPSRVDAATRIGRASGASPRSRARRRRCSRPRGLPFRAALPASLRRLSRRLRRSSSACRRGERTPVIRDPATRAALRAASLGDAGERRESA